MHAPAALLAILMVCLAGCAASYREPDLPVDHPASPAAESAPIAAPSGTLAINQEPSAGPNPAGATEESGNDPRPSGSGPHTAPYAHGEARAPDPPAAGATRYICPMHPEITSPLPDQRCPKCGMRLVKVEPERRQ